MVEHQESNAPFDARRAQRLLTHDGSLAQLRETWKRLVERDAKAIIVNQHTVGIMVVLVLIGGGLMLGGLVFRVLLWIGLAMLGFSLYVYYRADAINRRDLLDTRKRKLVEALLARLERDLDPEQRVVLEVDFHSPRTKAVRQIGEHWSSVGAPNTEPLAHPWLSLQVPLAGFDVELRMRSLLGTSGGELRLRDELELQLSSGTIAATAEPDLHALAHPATTLLAHRIDEGRARLYFRGARAATRRAPTYDGDEVVLAIVGSVLRPLLPEGWRSWDVQHGDALLTGPAVLAHLDSCATRLGPRASRAEA